MTFNINEMMATVSRAGGVAKTNLFSVMINPPAWNSSQAVPRLIQFMADNAQLPGLTFATNDVKNLGYGPTFKLPHTPLYTDVDMTIMLDNNGEILQFFHQWMQNIINMNPEGNSSSGYNGAKTYAVQYPSNYITTISITVYNPASEEIISYTLNEAYPLRIGQPGLDWGATNAILRLPVTFTFRTWTATTMKRNSSTLRDDLQSFNPYARTLNDEKIFNSTVGAYESVEDIFRNNAISLINNNTTTLNKFF